MTEIMHMEAFTDKALRETPNKLSQGQTYPRLLLLRQDNAFDSVSNKGVIMTLVDRLRALRG